MYHLGAIRPDVGHAPETSVLHRPSGAVYKIRRLSGIQAKSPVDGSFRQWESAGFASGATLPVSMQIAPPDAEYRLTERGRQLAPVVRALSAWT